VSEQTTPSKKSDQLQTRDARMAAKVLSRISVHKWSREQNRDEIKQYGAFAASLPALVRSAGLLQALAYAEVRGSKDGQEALVADLQSVIGKKATDLVALDLVGYMQATRETLLALLWFKRFAISVLGYNPEKDGVDDDTTGD
jgi:CRISPR-associated protein Cmr5